MLKRISSLLFGTLLVVACGSGSPHDTVESLQSNPKRLKGVMTKCREDHAKMGDAECNVASEAFRRRFIGNNESQRTH